MRVLESSSDLTSWVRGCQEKTQLFWEQKPKQMWKNMNRKVQVRPCLARVGGKGF